MPPEWKEILDSLRRAGFPLVGVASAVLPGEAVQRYRGWQASVPAEKLRYMEARRAWREDITRWLPWARSVICVALPYNTRSDRSLTWTTRGRLWVSRYAWGRDYHKVLRRLLNPVARGLEERGVHARACVDSAPLLERAYAVEAGLGFLGKSTMLINPRLGSYLFLGEIVTDLEPPPSTECGRGGCGKCDFCMKACPTGALEPRVLSPEKCISTWTIEEKGEFTHEPPPFHGHLFGCDRCQEVCPFNRGAPLSEIPDFEPRDPWFAPKPERIHEMSPEEWDRSTAGTPLRRISFEDLQRNARWGIIHHRDWEGTEKKGNGKKRQE